MPFCSIIMLNYAVLHAKIKRLFYTPNTKKHLHMTIRALIFFAITLITASYTQQAYAEKAQIGTIIEIEGTGTLQSDLYPIGKATTISLSPAKSDFPVFLNDVVETGPDSKVHILFIDDTELTLGENARLQIDEYIFDPDNTDSNAGRFSITRGAFLFVSGLITKISKPDVQVNTAYGTIGIRGTEFWGGELDDEYGILVQDGEITVQNERGRVRVGKGQGTSLRSRSAMPSRAKTWSPEKIQKAQNKVAMKRKAAIMRRVAEKKEMHGVLRAKYKENMKQHFRQMKEQKDLHKEQDKGRYNKRIQNEKRGDIMREKQEEKREAIRERIQDKRENTEKLPSAGSEETAERTHLQQRKKHGVQRRNAFD